MSETQTNEYRFKKDMPGYYENRLKEWASLTKQKYQNNPELKEKRRLRAKQQYQEMKLALQKVRNSPEI